MATMSPSPMEAYPPIQIAVYIFFLFLGPFKVKGQPPRGTKNYLYFIYSVLVMSVLVRSLKSRSLKLIYLLCIMYLSPCRVYTSCKKVVLTEYTLNSENFNKISLNPRKQTAIVQFSFIVITQYNVGSSNWFWLEKRTHKGPKILVVTYFILLYLFLIYYIYYIIIILYFLYYIYFYYISYQENGISY